MSGAVLPRLSESALLPGALEKCGLLGRERTPQLSKFSNLMRC